MQTGGSTVIEEGIYSYLTSVSAITSLVNKRIYPMTIPQGTELPAIAYQKITGVRIHTMNTDPGLSKPRIQFTTWANTYTSAKSVANEIRIAIQNQKNTTWGSTTVQGVFFENEVDFYDPDTQFFSVVCDAIIWHTE